MGKIKNKTIELANLYSDCLWISDDIVQARKLMREELSTADYEFFIENIDFITELALEE